MSDTSNSSPITCRRGGVPTRTRVTEVSQVIVATRLIAVCVAGNIVAQHFATPNGIVVVRSSLQSFLDHAQQPLDSNHRPFRKEVQSLEVVEADAKQVPITKGAPRSDGRSDRTHFYGTAGLPPQLVSQLRRAFFDHGRELDARAVSAELGLHEKTVKKYFKQFAAEAAASAPVTKPNGKLL